MEKSSLEDLRNYPHMFPRDIAIWKRFIAKYGEEYDHFDYDIKVGEGGEPDPSWNEKIREMQETLSKKRIDVVGHKATKTEIIEVKPDASCSAIGQALAYAALYGKENPGAKHIIPVIVTSRKIPDMDYLCSQFGIRLVVP